MREITLTIKLSNGKSKATHFTIWRRAGLERKERFALIHEGAEIIGEEEWGDESFGVYEKQAALSVGIERGESFFVKFEYV